MITVGIYALLGREVTTATVAAVLTVLGYSIYDTIIIFDRIRENIPLMKRASFPTLANVSLWETIPRSLATTFITLLPISTLYFFGGETLKDFAFALLVGIGAGAYSSIFIAAPLLSWLKEREPEYARRKEEAFDPGSVGGLLKEAEELAAAQPTPDLIPDAFQHEDGDGDEAGDAVPEPATATAGPAGSQSKRDRRRQRRSSRPAWPGQITRSSRSASSSTSWRRSCAPASTSWPTCRRRRASASRASSGSSAARSSRRVELRLAQLEHRLKLLEQPAAASPRRAAASARRRPRGRRASCAGSGRRAGRRPRPPCCRAAGSSPRRG